MLYQGFMKETEIPRADRAKTQNQTSGTLEPTKETEKLPNLFNRLTLSIRRSKGKKGTKVEFLIYC